MESADKKRSLFQKIADRTTWTSSFDKTKELRKKPTLVYEPRRFVSHQHS
jgi:hypothetical protein